MDRSDFVERGELKVDFLKYYRLVSRWACKENDLNIADLELLFYLDPIKFFNGLGVYFVYVCVALHYFTPPS